MARGPAPTRSNLLRARRRLARVEQGAELLTRKRQALVRELVGSAGPAIEARARIEAVGREGWPLMLDAVARHGPAGLGSLALPERVIEVDVVPTDVWGVRGAAVTRRGEVVRVPSARGHAPGGSGPTTDAAAAAFERLVELLLDAATGELRLRRLADALGRTTRQVNTLERRVAPRLRESVAGIRQQLEEREREDLLRLKRLLGAPAEVRGQQGSTGATTG